jgi:N6-adenosine-specific RNA methylase IME4
MSLEDICRIPISDLAADNCALFLWAVWPSIFDAKTVIDAWGFTYKTKAWTWIKANKNGMGYFTGMGFYTRANDEPCLLAVKGRMPVAVHDELALIYSPVRRHSQKPDEQYGKIERLYPGHSYIELFARRPRPVWESVGNGIDGRDITDAIHDKVLQVDDEAYKKEVT